MKAMTPETDFEIARQLWRHLLRCLHSKLKGGKASAEILQCARHFLADQGYKDYLRKASSRKQLEELHKVYVLQLLSAVRHNPSASIFAEVHRFLRQSGISVQSHRGATEALQVLADDKLPFTFH